MAVDIVVCNLDDEKQEQTFWQFIRPKKSIQENDIHFKEFKCGGRAFAV
jgi:hypothetical protein